MHLLKIFLVFAFFALKDTLLNYLSDRWIWGFLLIECYDIIYAIVLLCIAIQYRHHRQQLLPLQLLPIVSDSCKITKSSTSLIFKTIVKKCDRILKLWLFIIDVMGLNMLSMQLLSYFLIKHPMLDLILVL